MKENRVVISGLGISSCLGHSLEEVTDSLYNGRSGIVESQERKEVGFRSSLTSKLPPFDSKYKLPRKVKKYMPEVGLYAALTWLKTIDQCGLNPENFIGPRVGVILGNDSTCEPLEELIDTIRKYKDTHFLGSNMIIKTMNSTCSMNLGPLIGAKGINITMSAACASGAHAVGYGYHLVKMGLQDAVITGGFQEMNWLSMASFDALRAFSTNEIPEKASRPFDGQRDGLVPGGEEQY